MTIRIVEDGPDITLTRSQHNRLRQEYEKAFQMFIGHLPTFEEYVRSRLNEQKTHLLKG